MNSKTIPATRVFSFLLALLIMFGASATYSWADASSTTMITNTGCYCYSTKSATVANRVDYLTFATEVEVTELGDTWATLEIDGETFYTKSSWLSYPAAWVCKTGVAAYADATSSTILGYVCFGDDLEVLGTSNSRTQCTVSAIYDKAGDLVDEDVTCYIKTANITDALTPMIVSTGCTLYSKAGTAYSAGTITYGEIVYVMEQNSTWTKILYDDVEYFISTKNLTDMTMRIIANCLAQRTLPKIASDVVHYTYWGQKVTVKGIYESATYGPYYWCEVSGDMGFLRGTSSSGTVYVGYCDSIETVATANFYEEASTSSTKLGTIPAYTELTLVSSNSNWVKVVYNGVEGYVSVSNVAYPTYVLNGSYYTSAYKLYKGTASGTYTDTEVSLLGVKEGTTKARVKLSSGTSVWVSTDSLTSSETETAAYVSATQATLHVSAAADSNGVYIPYKTALTIIGGTSASTGWLEVIYEGETWYLYQESANALLTDGEPTFASTGETDLQQEVLDLALSFLELDTAYGAGDNSGVADEGGVYTFDCSGFATYVLDTVMQQYVPTYDLPSETDMMLEVESIYNEGYTGAFSAITLCEDGTIDLDSLEPGDVVFFDLEDDDGIVDHCGIYLGDGEFIHSAYSWDGICVMPLSGIYEDGFLCAMRYLPETIEETGCSLWTTSVKTNVYSEMDSASEVVVTLGSGVEVTLLFTDSGNWCYVECDDGTCGFVYVDNLSDTLEDACETRYIASATQNLYAQPSSGDYITLVYGTEVTYHGRYARNSNYYSVSYDGTVYYVYLNTTTYDSIDELLVTSEDDLTVIGAGTVTYGVNMRSLPSTSSEVVQTVSKGTELTVLTETSNGSWYYVELEDGTRGFVSTKYVELNG